MAKLEISDLGRKTRTIVELRPEPLAVGFDTSGGAAWGIVARQVAAVHDGHLHVDGEISPLAPGKEVEVHGLVLVYRPDEKDVRNAALNEIGHLLWTVENPEQLFDRALDALVRVLDAGRAAIVLLDDDEQLQVRAVRGEGLAINQAIASATLESGAAILTSEASVTDDDEDAVTIDLRSILCAPLRHSGRSHGLVYVDNAGREGSFSNDELDFVAALAHLAAFALDGLTQTELLREENVLLRSRLGLAGWCTPRPRWTPCRRRSNRWPRSTPRC